jgi:hypothetical protein
MTVTLSDQAWAEICAAAARHTPDGEARVVLATILFKDYPAFRYDRARVTEALKRSERMLKQLRMFAVDYISQFPDANADDARARLDLQSIERLRQRPLAVLLAARAIQRAHVGHRNIQRELLYHWLCNAWIDHFHGELTYSRPSLGGPPRGPLVEFMLTAFRQVDAMVGREAVAVNIRRERSERENVRQLVLRLRLT